MSSFKVTDSEGQTGQLCNWINQVTLDDIPEELQTRAKYLILDGIACALVGAHLPWSEKAVRAISEMEQSGTSSVFGWEMSVTPLSAALLNSSFIQGFELDDWHSQAPLHSNSIILPALFAAGQHLGTSNIKTSGKTFILAYLIGLEVGPRVGQALYGADMLTRGWHSGAVFGPAASAAAVSKLMNLPAGQIEDALGSACTQACGLMSAQFESDVKRMQHGFAARSGLLAAMLARSGYVGIKRVFEQEYGGFLTMFGQGSQKEPPYRVDEISKGLGTEWKTNGVRVKPYSSMAGTHPTVDCVRKLQEDHPDKMKQLDKIKSIVLELGEAAFHHGGWEAKRPLRAIGAQMSNTYICATQLVDGEVLPAQFRNQNLERDEVWNLVNKSTCRNMGKGNGMRQKVTVAFDDGTELAAEVEAAKGVNPPLTNEEIVDKWRKITVEVIDKERMERIEKTCLELESLEDITVLGELLRGITKNPIA
ncbi:hypothetical protein BP6252_06758 [Coleophoma cylindrospora]|uniref:2-methylcitrate dehydratase PrpD n=1 Tax=Coleophoma cylindrospora TaxID=1849047 RepID=A0A3D8RG60_9HELO|nr:hypothetical protein BP6252_06758 [Coleophoma cylindrospora]